MSENKCCGNCKHFKFEDVKGFGYCELIGTERNCEWTCDNHNLKKKKRTNAKKDDDYNEVQDGWTEITQDNVDEIDAIDPNRVVVATMIEGFVFSSVLTDSDTTLKACSELGGYYYYVLPELKIE